MMSFVPMTPPFDQRPPVHLRNELVALSHRIHGVPELAFEEYRASGWLAEWHMLRQAVFWFQSSAARATMQREFSNR